MNCPFSQVRFDVDEEALGVEEAALPGALSAPRMHSSEALKQEVRVQARREFDAQSAVRTELVRSYRVKSSVESEASRGEEGGDMIWSGGSPEFSLRSHLFSSSSSSQRVSGAEPVPGAGECGAAQRTYPETDRPAEEGGAPRGEHPIASLYPRPPPLLQLLGVWGKI